MLITLQLPHLCTVHHGPDGLRIELPDAAAPAAAAQLSSGRRLTVNEVCARYQITRPTLAKWERAGLQSIAIGQRSKWFTETELARFEASQPPSDTLRRAELRATAPTPQRDRKE